MKKVYLILVAFSFIALIGCTASSKETTGDSKDIAKLEQKITTLEKENKDLKAQVEKLKEPEVVSKDNKTKADEGKPLEIKKGGTLTTDRMTIKIKKIELTYDVLPDNTNGLYTHYAAESGHVYIHVDMDVKNLQKQDLSCDDIMNVVANYNNGFTYDAFAVPEDNNTGFTYANITSIKPLQTKGMRFLIDCPQEVEKEKNPLFLTFDIDKKEYKYTIK